MFFLTTVEADGSIIVIPKDVVIRGSSEYVLHLVGFFIEANMNYREVNFNLRRMWRRYDIVDISLGDNGFCLFKFKRESRMQKVLENGTWLVDGVPLFLRKWRPGPTTQKIEPNKIPLWIGMRNVTVAIS
ncbi:hypothetical protein OSB04_019244 [Centaurea solstitialis]|uniref:DUF4283 domain-containing protein n=1 Tax=Centaurea solstitialis TaxID=347529 RepID=A0AA38T1G2_9ASTR|nr:hypothetical protein OSB04_019244 [Centaurea solstitialis]